ncbi:efflux transporter outer membrane subunit [Rhodocytophaga rosea]|uniref:Efflux transporter outer membrane subunit n=1 Tax=Rhodocytophaga rosea TaxID=2704465 RepID=A0A6C0GSH3_9BACT|nr:efflux transporter outer membrane subunit [Rhodocytophaga rosea]QHT71049.1 efflux transporter outer membrane subunit [Rhodocytophaga rosea]
MHKKLIYKFLGVVCLSLAFSACTTPSLMTKTENRAVPARYINSQDTTNTAKVRWQQYFTDPNLNALIDTALKNNQELNITLQEIQIARNEVRARTGEYLPFIGLQGGAGVEKAGRYTFRGATEASTDIEPDKEMPDPFPDFMIGAFASWEVDIWHKLRNAKKSALTRYMSSVQGRNFMVTNLIAEIATSYYELLALDNQLDIVKQNIEIQSNALEIVRLQKTATRVTELAVRRFEAQVLNTRSLQYNIQQRITEAENRINFLVGRFPQPVQRNSQSFNDLVPDSIYAGIPSQLLENRPDVKQAELDLAAAKLDVKVAKANFYPSLRITGGIGLRAFDPSYLLKTPESMLFSLAGDLAAPLINRNAIKAAYYSANARQIQAVYNYQRTILNAYIEVANQLSNINNMGQSYELKAQEVEALTQSITISNNLFRSARADYMEVLLTQRDALESRFDLVETKMQQLNAMVNIYRALGGGWY